MPRNHAAHPVPTPSRAVSAHQGQTGVPVVSYLVAQPLPPRRGLLTRRRPGDPATATGIYPAGLVGKTKEQLEAEEEEREQGRTWYRLRRHLIPHGIAAGIAAAAGVCWLVAWLTGDPTSVAMTAALISFGTVGLAAAVARSRFSTPAVAAWRLRLLLAGLFASTWISITALLGPSWESGLALLSADVLLGARWWRHIRYGYPTGPPAPDPEEEEKQPEIVDDWEDYVACAGGVLPNSRLFDHTEIIDETGKLLRIEFTIQLRPGKHTLTHALNGLPLIASGIRQWPAAVVIDEGNNPNQLRLKVIKDSPVQDTVYLEQARWDAGWGPGIVPLGPYVDGQGEAPLRLWTPGESGHAGTDQDGSAWSTAVIASVGSGKSSLAEGVLANAWSSGLVVGWFIDPQDGASSPALQQYADWYVGLTDAEKMLAALERIAKARFVQNSANGWGGFRPTPDRPLLVCVIDECHRIFKNPQQGDRYADLVREFRKVGILVIAISQGVTLDTFGGSDMLRSSLMAGNGIVMRTESRQTGNLMAGLPMDPQNLPRDIPGYGYTTTNKHARTAPFRGRYCADPTGLFASLPRRSLDPYAAKAAGRDYAARARTVEERRAAAAAEMAAIMAGSLDPDPIYTRPTTVAALDEQAQADAQAALDTIATQAAGDAPTIPVTAFPVLNTPTPPPPEQPAGPNPFDALPLPTAIQLILGSANPHPVAMADLIAATGKSDTAIRTVLKALIADGQADQPARGLYRHTPQPHPGDPQ